MSAYDPQYGIDPNQHQYGSLTNYGSPTIPNGLNFNAPVNTSGAAMTLNMPNGGQYSTQSGQFTQPTGGGMPSMAAFNQGITTVSNVYDLIGKFQDRQAAKRDARFNRKSTKNSFNANAIAYNNRLDQQSNVNNNIAQAWYGRDANQGIPLQRMDLWSQQKAAQDNFVGSSPRPPNYG